MSSALHSKQYPLPSPLHLEGLWVSHSVFREGGQDSQIVSQGIVPITSEASSSYEALILQMVAQEDGFVQFFIANETLHDVYFDDISGMVRRPKIIQEAHYNPFGLPLAGLTTLGNPEYAYFFTGKELYEDEALQWYDYGARMYDVQIGRWTSHDPEYQFASPYDFCGNNAVNYVDPDGRFVWFIPIALAVVGAYVGGSVANETANPFKWDYAQGKTWAGMGIGAVVGFGIGVGISAGLATAGITTNTGFFTALGIYTPTCPGFALNGYAAAKLAPVAYKAAGIVVGTAGVAGGGTAAYYNVPGFAEGMGAGFTALGAGLTYAGEQIALAAAGGGAALAQVIAPPVPLYPPYAGPGLSPWLLGPFLGWQFGSNWAQNIEQVNGSIADFLINLGVPQEYLRQYYPPPRVLPGFPDAVSVGKPYGRARWKLPDGKIIEWDSQHGEVELYDKVGDHLGAFDPNTGKQKKPRKKGRRIKP